MFDFSNTLFWYRFVFVVEIMVAEAFATYTLEKRKHFALRVFLSVLLIFAAIFLLPIFSGSPLINTISYSVMFLLIFFLTIIALKICYDEKFLSLFFCGILAYTTQHISYSTYKFFVNITGIGTYNVYGGQIVNTVDVFSVLAYLGVYSIIYWFVWAFVENQLRQQEKMDVDTLLIIGFSFVLISDVILEFMSQCLLSDTRSDVELLINYLYRLISTVFIYLMLYFVLRKQEAENELSVVESMWRQDKKNYEVSKENIELINVKCHDLKHQIRKLKDNNFIEATYLKELEDGITIYDMSLKTGCEPLDIILAENSIVMTQFGINMLVFADGKELDFMSKTDIYSLFGNIISNGVNAVKNLKDDEKKTIKLDVKRLNKMIVIHEENYCEEIKFGSDGLPVTSNFSGEHGYGLKSIRMIAKKYGGVFNLKAENGIFYLDIIIPVTN